MSGRKKRIREAFRQAVWGRDGHECRMCGALGVVLDAHHITDRNEMPNGGYVASNGISLCEVCHVQAEVFHASGGVSWPQGWHPDELYEVIGSSYEQAVCDSARLG